MTGDMLLIPRKSTVKKFADGIQKTIQWYLDNEEWWQPIVNGDYVKYYDRMYGSRGSC